MPSQDPTPCSHQCITDVDALPHLRPLTTLSQCAAYSGEVGESKVFWGLARPPTSYGAYAGGDEKNAK